jgi:hypothetical protein
MPSDAALSVSRTSERPGTCRSPTPALDETRASRRSGPRARFQRAAGTGLAGAVRSAAGPTSGPPNTRGQPQTTVLLRTAKPHRRAKSASRSKRPQTPGPTCKQGVSGSSPLSGSQRNPRICGGFVLSGASVKSVKTGLGTTLGTTLGHVYHTSDFFGGDEHAGKHTLHLTREPLLTSARPGGDRTSPRSASRSTG